MATLREIFEETLNEEMGTQAFRALYSKYLSEADEKQKAVFIQNISSGNYKGALKLFKSFYAGGQMLNSWDDVKLLKELELIEANKTRPRANMGSIMKSNRLKNQKDALLANKADAKEATAKKQVFSKKTDSELKDKIKGRC